MMQLNPGEIKKQKELLEVIRQRNTLQKISDVYDADPQFASALNYLIRDFEYPNFSGKYIHDVADALANLILPEYPSVNAEFFQAIDALELTHQKFQRSEISSFDHSREREQSISLALIEMMKSFGIALEKHLHINANGEYSLSTKGEFGVDFAHLINKYGPRTGIPGPNKLLEGSTWCYINHFQAEKMIVDFNNRYRLNQNLAPEVEKASPSKSSNRPS